MEAHSPPRRLLRSRDDRVIAGVCGGLGEHTGIDPVVFRVVLAVAAFAGGAGLAAYVIAWICIPERREDGSEPPLRRAAGSGPQIDGVAAVVLAVLGLVVFVGLLDDRDRGPFDGDGGLLLLLLVGGGLWWWVRQDRDVPPVPPSSGPPPSYEPPTPSGLDDLLSPVPSVPPRPTATATAERRPRSPLPLIGLSVLLLLWGALVLVDLTITRVDEQVALGLSLAVVGGILVVGARYGRAHGLIALGAVLAVVGGLSSVIDVSPRGGFGERFWEATSTEDLRRSYELGAGDARLDLSDLELDRSREVDVRLWAGELLVIVPRDVNLEIDGHVGLGELTILGQTDEGVDVDESVDVDEGEGPVLRLDVKVGMGELGVVRGAA